MTFGEKLKKLRSENALTQEQLAEKIFVTRTAVSKWETGEGYPSIDSLKAISNLFNVSVDELISDADIENKKSLDVKAAKRSYFSSILLLLTGALVLFLSFFFRGDSFFLGYLRGLFIGISIVVILIGFFIFIYEFLRAVNKK